MKSLLIISFVLVSISLFGQFSGYYDPANWTTTNTGCQPGTVDVSAAPAAISLISGDNSFQCGSSVVSYSITAVCGTICFDWNYSSVDCNGSYYDRFGYSVNGVPTQLSTDCINCGLTQSGSTCVTLEPGDVFSFYVDAIDTYCGPATVTISDFSGPDDICHDENGNPKVELCHKGTTICVAPSAVAAHLEHGDYVGPCCVAEEEGEGFNVDDDHLNIDEGSYAHIAPRADLIHLLHATLGEKQLPNTAFAVYPNPATDVATIQFNRVSGPVTVSVYSLNGQLMQKTNAIATPGGSMSLNVADLSSGNYEIRVQAEQGTVISEQLSISRK